MSHKSAVNLIRDTAKSLADNILFGYGRTSDFDVKQKFYPAIWLDPLSASPAYTVNDTENFQKTWTARMLFYQLDNADSIETKHEKILNEMDDYVDRFIQRLNAVDEVVITSISQQPFIKATADILTGWLVTFNLTLPDDFDYCLDEEV